MTVLAKRVLISLAVVGSFILLGVVVGALSANGIITPQMAGLMMVGLLGMYVGFGVLIITYRFVSRLK